MIIVRYTFYPSDDAPKFKAALVKWRDAHPESEIRILNGVTGRQKTVYLEIPFADDDYTGICEDIFNVYYDEDQEWLAWAEEYLKDLDIYVETKELLRLID